MSKVSSRARRMRGTVVVAAAAAPLLGVGQAEAADLVVTNLDDSGPGSLRQALVDANADQNADTITFADGLTGSIVLSSGQLAIQSPVTITGPGSAVLTVSAGGASRVLYVGYLGATPVDVVVSGLTLEDGVSASGAGIWLNDEHLTLDDVVLDSNTTSGDGAGLHADGHSMGLTIRNSVISGNSSGDDGGGVYIEDTGPLSVLIEDSVISGNHASGDGGGIYLYDPDSNVTLQRLTISGNTTAGNGGGVFLYNMDTGTLTIDSCTISGNSAVGDGGGIYLYHTGDEISIVTTTVSGNTANSGGGIFTNEADSGATLIAHSTIVGNTSTIGGGISNYGIFVLDHSIVADNSAPSGPDLSGSDPVSANYSLIEATSGAPTGTGLIMAVDPDLGPLADNGGPTWTHLPLVGSPAIGAGNALGSGFPETDQRGGARQVGDVIDIGAVEVGYPVDDEFEVGEDGVLEVEAPGLLDNDSGEGIPVLVDGPSHGVVDINEDGSFTYTPDEGYSGTDSFTYSIDGQQPATVNITVGSETPVPETTVPETTVPTEIPATGTDPVSGVLAGAVVVAAGAVTLRVARRRRPATV